MQSCSNCLLLVLVPHVFFLLVATVSHREISVPSDGPPYWSLQDYLCGDKGLTVVNGDTIILNSSFQHTVTTGPFCLLRNLLNITIRSDTISTPAHITCKQQTHFLGKPTRGFGFLGIGGLTLTDLSLHHCGGEIVSNPNITVNSSHFYFPSNQAAVLLFSRCSLVNLRNLQIDGCYFGYALLIDNSLVGVDIFNMNIADSFTGKNKTVHELLSPGSGILILATESSLKLVINKSHIVNNINNPLQTHPPEFSGQFFNNAIHGNKVPIIGAGGLSIIFSPYLGNLASPTQVYISHSYIERNKGKSAGGVLILYWDNKGISHNPGSVLSVKFEHVLVGSNSLVSTGNGAGMAVYILSSISTVSSLYNSQADAMQGFLEITNSSFSDHRDYNNTKNGGALYVAVFADSKFTTNISIENSFFISNAASVAGSAIHSESLTLPDLRQSEAKVFLLMKGVKTLWNGKRKGAIPYNEYEDTAVIEFRRISRVRMVGIKNGSFSCTDNRGSCLSATDTTVELQGIIQFIYNLGIIGGAIQLHSAAFLIFVNPIQALFENNSAFLYGGAIYAVSESRDKTVCPMKLQHKGNSNTIVFSNNFAHIGGHSLYVEGWINCPSELKRHFVLPREYEHCKKDIDTTCNEVTSPPTTIQLCEQDLSQPLLTYPGSTLNFQVTALNAMNQTVNCPVHARLTFKDKCISNDRKFCPLQMISEQQIQQAENCTTLSYKILSMRPLLATMVFAVLGNPPSFYIKVSIRECPLGFYHSPHSRTCECEAYLQELSATCNISSSSISIPANVWLGYVEFSNTSGYALAFPTEDLWPHKTTTVVNMTNVEFFCQGSTTGVLCGKCIEGYSRVFGSDYCFKCSSNLWLLTILIYIVIGMGIVIFMLCLRISIANGLVSGLVFYANIVEIRNSVLSIGHKSWYIDYVITILNLNTVPTPACFYIGMTAVGKVALNFLFPAYLLGIVIIIIVISRCSITISNVVAHSSVQVLATLLYFIFARLMLNVIDILTPITVIVPHRSYKVWLKDGNVVYWDNHGHKLLVILAVVVTVVYLLPFLAFTTFASMGLRMHWVRQIRPFIDAYHGQYRDKWGFWFGARLWVIVCSYVSYSFLRGNDPMLMLILNIILLVSFTFAQLQFRPFRNRWVNLGDSLILLNLIVLLLVSVFSLLMGHVGATGTVATMLVSSIVALVVATISYHCLLLMMRIHCLRAFYYAQSWSWFSALRRFKLMKAAVVHDEESNEPELREPLLDAID